jgi:uncharacterized OB-fold protein
MKSSIPSKRLCSRYFLEDNAPKCKGKYRKVREVYKIVGQRIPNLLLHKCDKCGHTVLPWESVLRVDKATAKHRAKTKERKQHGNKLKR